LKLLTNFESSDELRICCFRWFWYCQIFGKQSWDC